MSVDRDDQQDDDVLARLRTHDISERRSRHLRKRCHAILEPASAANASAGGVHGALVRRVVVPALGGAWCLAYVVEIIRYTAAIYAYFGAR